MQIFIKPPTHTPEPALECMMHLSAVGLPNISLMLYALKPILTSILTRTGCLICKRLPSPNIIAHILPFQPRQLRFLKQFLKIIPLSGILLKGNGDGPTGVSKHLMRPLLRFLLAGFTEAYI